MGRLNRRVLALLIVGVLGAVWVSLVAIADNTESLGPPAIEILPGSGFVMAGTGMKTQPGAIAIDVPGDVVQALLYWEGMSVFGDPGDDTITVNDIPVMGDLIGGPTPWGWKPSRTFTYRAEITQLGLVSPGPNLLIVKDMNFTRAQGNEGAGLLVIFDDGTKADIQILDGNDYAFRDFVPPLDATVGQVFGVTPASTDRTATIGLFVASVADDRVPPEPFRPTGIEFEIDGILAKTSVNVLDSKDGLWWDTAIFEVVIPAGATSFGARIFSRDDLGSRLLPASLVWVAAAISMEAVGDEGCTIGFWKNHLDAWRLTGLDPSQTVESLFSETSTYRANRLPDRTLLEALSFGGGPGDLGAARLLVKQGVGAVLNARHPLVDYPRAADDIVHDVNAALATHDPDTMLQLKDALDTDNNLGCPLNNMMNGPPAPTGPPGGT